MKEREQTRFAWQIRIVITLLEEDRGNSRGEVGKREKRGEEREGGRIALLRVNAKDRCEKKLSTNIFQECRSTVAVRHWE